MTMFTLARTLGTGLALATLLARPVQAEPELCAQLPPQSAPLVTQVDGLQWDSLDQATAEIATPSLDQRVYLAAIDEVHARLRAAGSRIGMAMIMYDICEIDPAVLETRLSAIHTDLDQIAGALVELHPSDQLVAVQHNYAQVVGLYQQGVTEMEKVAQDGNPVHMRDAYPLTKTASDGLADLENLIWNPALPNLNPPAPGDGGGAGP